MYKIQTRINIDHIRIGKKWRCALGGGGGGGPFFKPKCWPLAFPWYIADLQIWSTCTRTCTTLYLISKIFKELRNINLAWSHEVGTYLAGSVVRRGASRWSPASQQPYCPGTSGRICTGPKSFIHILVRSRVVFIRETVARNRNWS